MTNPFLRHSFEFIGGFKLEKHNCLLQAEEEWFESYETRKFEAGLVALEFANAIANEMKITGEEALKLIEQAQAGGDSVSLLMRYPKQMRDVIQLKHLDQNFVPAVATLALQSRVSSSWLLGQAENLEEAFGLEFSNLGQMEEELNYFSGLPSESLSSLQIDHMDELHQALSAQSVWVRSFTRKLSRATVLELVNYIGSERRGWIEPSPAPEEVVTLGESSPSTEASLDEGTELTGTNAITPSKARVTAMKSTHTKAGRVALPA